MRKTKSISTAKKPKNSSLPTLRLAQEMAERNLGRLLSIGQKLPSVRRLGPQGSWQIEVQVVDGPQMKALNSQYRGKKKTTDVLSFPSPSPFFDRGMLGQIVVCLSVLRRQSKRFEHSDEIELIILLVHGFLHLLGLDHEESLQKKKQMEQLEELMLSALGLEKSSSVKDVSEKRRLSAVKGMLLRTKG